MDWVRLYMRELSGEKKESWLLSTYYDRTRKTSHHKYPGTRPRGYFRGHTKIAAFLLLISITYDSLPQHNLQINCDSESKKV